VQSLRRWWNGQGRLLYPHARRLLLTADAAAPTAPHPRLEIRFAAFALTSGLRSPSALPAGHIQMEQDRAPTVLHITMNWRAGP